MFLFIIDLFLDRSTTFFMTELETKEPVWQYEAEDNALVDMDKLHLIVWPDGLCITGFDQDGTPLKIKTFLFRENWDTGFMQHLFENDPLFAGPQPISRVWLAEARNILVPGPLYEENEAGEWLGKFHFLEAGESLMHISMQPHQDIQMIFPVKDALKALFDQYLPEARISALSLVAMQQPETGGPFLEIINLPKMILLSLRENQRFLLHQIYPYENAENVVYKVALILEEKGLAQDQVRLSLAGIAPFWNNLNTELPLYFDAAGKLEDTTAVSLTFLKKLFSCA